MGRTLKANVNTERIFDIKAYMLPSKVFERILLIFGTRNMKNLPYKIVSEGDLNVYCACDTGQLHGYDDASVYGQDVC